MLLQRLMQMGLDLLVGSHILDESSNFLTDESGNRLTG